MTVDAPPHVEWVLCGDDVHRVDLSMALAAVEPEVHVRLVRKLNVVGEVVDLHPFDRLARLPRFVNFLNFGRLRLHLAVAVHAHVDARDRGVLSLTGAHVTVATRRLVNTGVQLMAKCNRLLRGVTLTRVHTR